MTQASVLCRYLAEHPDWETTLPERYLLRIKREGPYAIFNYGIGCDFADPIVQEARGIILDTERREVVCWPFRKFGNYNERYADPIDWSTARVQEKVDGSIIKLWYEDRAERWVFSTNASIRAEQATLPNDDRSSFLDIIRDTEEYRTLSFDRLCRRYTYIFELVSPRTQVVIRYDRARLVHIGTRDRVSGLELEADIGVGKPMSYPLHSPEDCIRAARALNDSGSASGAVEKEGFVVVDAAWNRVKIKSPDYLVTHRIVENRCWTRQRVLEQLCIEKREAWTLCRLAPDYAHIFLYYAYRLEELSQRCDRVAEYARALLREAEGDRGAVARVLNGTPLSAVGFWALGNEDAGRLWLQAQPMAVLQRLIPEYTAPAPDF